MTDIALINNLDLYAFSAITLIVLANKTISTKHRISPQTRLFDLLLALNFILMLADGIQITFDGERGATFRAFLTLNETVFYCLQPLTSLVWFRYVREIVYHDRYLSMQRRLHYIVPALISIALAVSSPWTGWYFGFDENNFYHRGPLTILGIALMYLYIFAGYILVMANRNKLDRRNFLALLMFPVLPAIGGALQTVFYGLVIAWPCMTISILVIYLAIQNELLMIDHLTDVNNRRSLDSELARKISTAKESEPFVVILLDLDDFKAINDKYGHVEGDKALEATALILRRCFHHHDFIARYGGDEFVVIIEIKTISNLDVIKKRLRTQVRDWNKTSGKPWTLEFSVGCAHYVPSEGLTPDGFLTEIDTLLYIDKNRPKPSNP